MTVTQSQFRAAMLDPQAAVPVGIVTPDGGPAPKRFAVYRNNVAVSLTEALLTGFPVIHRLVGDAFFRAMAGVYLRRHPPSSPLMMHYGQEMPQFLKRFEPAKTLPYLPDIAKIELAMRHAYHAADVTPCDPQALTRISPDDLMSVRFGFAPAVRIISSQFPIHGIYRANTVEGAPKPKPGAEAVLITRPEFDPIVHHLEQGDADVVVALQNGQSLGAALTLVNDHTPDLGSILGLLLSNGAISEIH